MTVRPKVNSSEDQHGQRESRLSAPGKTRPAAKGPSIGRAIAVHDATVNPMLDLSSDAPRAASLSTIGTPIKLDSLIFDPDWYRKEYPDVAASGIDPVTHYLDNGASEGRNPNQYFDTTWYVQHNPDVTLAGLNPFIHYVFYGAKEGRKPSP